MFFLFCFHLLCANTVSSRDFLATNFDQGSILRMNEDYKVMQTYKFIRDRTIENFQARCQNDRLLLIWLNQPDFIMRYIDSNSIMMPPDDLKFNSDNIFDVQANGDLLVMTTINETHTTFSLGNFTTSEVETVLSVEGSHLRNVAIHPTKRIFYYLTCQGSSFSFNVFDVDVKKGLQRFVPPVCLDGFLYDDTNDILWAFDGDQIYKGNLKELKFEVVYQREAGLISSIALGNNDLLIMHSKGSGTQVYNFTLNPIPLKQLTLQPFTITPAYGFLKGQFFLMDVDNKQLILYDKDFKQIWKNAVRIENKDVSSVNAISRTDGSMEFYWIHPSNGGKMEVVLVSSAGTVTNQKTLQFGNESITDFTIHQRSNTFYMASNTSIISSVANVSSEHQEFRSFYDMEKPIKALASLNTALMLTFCDGTTKGFSSLSIKNPSEPLPHDTLECFEDVQVIATNPYFASRTGIYAASPRMDSIEKLYDVRGLANIATYDEHVYFVASPTDMGPGVYKIPTSRSRLIQSYQGGSSNNFVTAIKGRCKTSELTKEPGVPLTLTTSAPRLTTKGNGGGRPEVSESSRTTDSTSNKSLSTKSSASMIIMNFFEFHAFYATMSSFLCFNNIL